MSLVLDTNVVRHLGAGDIDPTGLHQFRTDGGSVQLADATISELTHQLVTGALPWHHWVAARKHLQELVPLEEPILSLHKLDLFNSSKPGKGRSMAKEVVADEEYYDAGWTMLLAANSSVELSSFRINLHSQGATMSLPAHHVASQHRAVRDNWPSEFEGSRAKLMELAPELLSSMQRRNVREAFEARLDAHRTYLDQKCPRSTPPASTRLDAYIRVKALLASRHLLPKQGYNAEKNANDYFDTELLKYLAPSLPQYLRQNLRMNLM